MQLLQATHWMRTFLPELWELEAPLRGLLEEFMCHQRFAKRVAARRVMYGSSEWAD